MRFAKLFDVGDNDQILITKGFDPKEKSELLVVSIKTDGGLSIDQNHGYDSVEERDLRFDAIVQKDADYYYKSITEFIHLMSGGES